MKLRRYCAKTWILSNPALLFRVLRGFFRAIVLRANTLRTIHILPTLDCQARCTMCSVAKFRKGNGNTLVLADYESIADQGAGMGALAVTLLGGEPLLVKNIAEIVRVFKSRRFYVSIVSNGIGFDEKRAKELRAAGLDSMHFGLESLDEEVNDTLRGYPGQCRGVMEGISICKELGLPVGLCTVLLPGEKARYSQLAEYCEKSGIRFSPATVARVGAAAGMRPVSEEEYEDVLSLLDRHPRISVDWGFSYFLKPRCPSGKEKIAITCYGDVMGCTLNHISFGNVRREPLKTIWQRAQRFSQFRKNSDRCLAAFDRFYIEHYLAPMAGADHSPVHYEDHPNITREKEPALFSSRRGPEAAS